MVDYLEDYKPLPGQLVFYDATAQIPQETIGFAAGHCTHYGEAFDTATTGPEKYLCLLTVRYLQRNPTDVAATGGTNWREYLPPKFQRRIFYPQLWSAQELEDWGKGWVESVLGEGTGA